MRILRTLCLLSLALPRLPAHRPRAADSAFSIPDYEAMAKNLWCGDFQADLNAYLAKHPNAPITT
jgi:hypothetical protein